MLSAASRGNAMHDAHDRVRAYGRRLAGVSSAIALAGLLSACTTVGPDYQMPADAAANKLSANAPFVSATGGQGDQARGKLFTSEALPAHWWRLYDDATLDGLVQRALAHNTDLRVAAANLERVRQMEGVAAGAGKPQIGAKAEALYGHVSGLSLLAEDYSPPNEVDDVLGVTLGYQIDVVGQIRRSIEAARADTEAAQAALDLVRINVAASTARAYAAVCSSGLQIRQSEQSIALQRQALDLSDRLREAGRTGSIDSLRAQAQLHGLQAALPTLQAHKRSGLFRLATLMGEAPGDFPAAVADCVTPPRVTAALPVGDGRALLRRRPDIRQAERQVAAATARIGVATGDLYPKIAIGLSASSAGPARDFLGKDAFSWGLGPLITWSVPSTGVVQAHIAQAEAGTRAAVATFDGKVLNALRETETALDAYARELQRRQQLEAARDAAEQVAQQARRLYQGGKTGYLSALDAERSLAQAEAALASSEGQLADDQVTLFLALGGGWQAEEVQARVEPDAAVATPAAGRPAGAAGREG